MFYLNTLFITGKKPGVQALLFNTSVDLCRGYIKNSHAHQNSQELSELTSLLLQRCFKQSHETPNFRQLSSAPFISHKHISPGFLHSDAASSVLFKTKFNHMMGF